MLTKDSVTVSVDAVVYYRVSNATVSIANVENAHHSTRLLAQTTLRKLIFFRITVRKGHISCTLYFFSYVGVVPVSIMFLTYADFNSAEFS